MCSYLEDGDQQRSCVSKADHKLVYFSNDPSGTNRSNDPFVLIGFQLYFLKIKQELPLLTYEEKSSERATQL